MKRGLIVHLLLRDAQYRTRGTRLCGEHQVRAECLVLESRTPDTETGHGRGRSTVLGASLGHSSDRNRQARTGLLPRSYPERAGGLYTVSSRIERGRSVREQPQMLVGNIHTSPQCARHGSDCSRLSGYRFSRQPGISGSRSAIVWSSFDKLRHIVRTVFGEARRAIVDVWGRISLAPCVSRCTRGSNRISRSGVMVEHRNHGRISRIAWLFGRLYRNCDWLCLTRPSHGSTPESKKFGHAMAIETSYRTVYRLA